MINRIVFLILLFASPLFGLPQQTQVNRAAFYSALGSKNVNLVNQQQQIATASGNHGFAGALMMRKAGLVGKITEKLSLFRSGHKLLDEAIAKDQSNPELRFLRLMVQENAPLILNYRGDITQDVQLLKKRFHQMHPEAQQVLLEYAKTSSILKPAEFKKA